MNAEVGLDKAEDELSARALDELVDRIMAHKEYPAHGGQQINLRDILGECDQDQLADCVLRALISRGLGDLREGVVAIVRHRINDSMWHEKMKQQLFEESQ